MTTERFANQASTALSTLVGVGDLSISVQATTHFPTSPEFRIRIGQELMLVTGVAGATWTVTRGIEGTVALSHAIGTAVVSVMTAGGLGEMRSEIESEIDAIPVATESSNGPMSLSDKTKLDGMVPGEIGTGADSVTLYGSSQPAPGQAPVAISATQFVWQSPAAGPPGSLQTTSWFNHTSSDINTYYDLIAYPDGSSGTDMSASATSGGGPVLIGGWATKSGVPGVTTIPAGLWNFWMYCYTNNVGSGRLSVVVYTRSSGGVETLQFTLPDELVLNSSFPVTIPVVSYSAIAMTVAALDRIVIKVYAKTSSSSSTTVHFGVADSLYASYFTYPSNGIPDASEANHGLMGVTDKIKLDGLVPNILAPTAISALITTDDQVVEVTGNTGPVTISLPITPRTNQRVGVLDGDGHASTYNIIVDGNGKLINGSSSPLTINVNYTSLSFIYDGSKWVIL